jgi:hypothetical protein
MKLTNLVLENVLPSQSHQIGRLSGGISLIEGDRDTGKTAIRNFIRDVVFGNPRYVTPGFSTAAYVPPLGSFTIQNRQGEYRLTRNWKTGELEIATLSGRPAAELDLTALLPGKLNETLHDAIFNFSLYQDRETFSRLTHVLHTQLGVPLGNASANNDVAFQSWSREMEAQRAQLTALPQRIEVLQRRRQQLVANRGEQDAARQLRLADLDREIQIVLQQISEIDLASKRARVVQLEQEITDLRIFIEDTVRRESASVPVPVKANLPDSYQLLYLRLDEIESQIRCWRRIQADVQAQRVRLKDEMVVWGELTLDAEEHPYHNARKLLITLEERINQTDHQARQWELAPVHQTDPSHSVREIQGLCHTMRQDLHSLSQELGQQYKSIRHRAAAAELKQLRHCYNVMNENIDRLVRRREQVLNEVRYLDAAGAEAIVRGEPAFLQCALHEGYLEARRRFVGPLPAYVEPVVLTARTDLTELRSRLQRLQSEMNQLQRWIVDSEANLMRLRARHSQLDQDKTALLTEFQRFGAGELDSVDTEIARLTYEYEVLLRRIDAERSKVQPPSNPILAQASNHLRNLTQGELQSVWLSDTQVDAIEVLDRQFLVRPLTVLAKSQLALVQLSLALAAKQTLAVEGIEFPTIIDDALVNFGREQVLAVAQLLGDLEKQGHQFILLSQSNQYLAETAGFARFLLPSRGEAASGPWAPKFFQRPSQVVPLSSSTNVFPATNSNVLNRWAAAGDIDPVTLPPLDGAYGSPLDANYPMSKYAVSSEAAEYQEPDDFIVRYPAPNTLSGDGHPRSGQLPLRPQRAVPVAVESIGDQFAFAPAWDESSELGGVDLFDLNRLRAFSDLGIETVGQLLTLHPESMPISLRERGVSSEQLNRWQAILWLLCTVPGMRVSDASILVACGVTEPEHLATSLPQQLFERVQRFLGSNEGQRFAIQSAGIDQVRIHGWLSALDASKGRWQQGSRLSRLSKRRNANPATVISPKSLSVPSGAESVGLPIGTSRPPQPTAPDHESYGIAAAPPRDKLAHAVRADLLPQPTFREPFIARPPRMRTPEPRGNGAPSEFAPRRPRPLPREQAVAGASDAVARAGEPNSTPEKSNGAANSQRPTGRPENKSGSESKLRFYLDLKDHIEAAPSIGPKTAERFERIGVRSVEDFLKQTAESMATKLKYKRITADLIRSWQHQTRLVCRIPNLRGHDAQLLVACNLTEPEKIAAMQPQRLLEIILPFARSKEGLKIVRTGKEPDLQEVSDWIKWASMTRSLHAA